MKIAREPQQPNIAQQAVDHKVENAEPIAARPKARKTAAKTKDTVDVAAPSLEAEVKNLQAEQAKRVQALKELVEEGKYEVSSREVAEKMLSKSSKQ